MGENDRREQPGRAEQDALRDETGRRSGAHGSGRHHRVRAMWHMDRCGGCGSIHRARIDADRAALTPRTSSYLTANRLALPRTAGPVPGRAWGRVDVNSVVLLAGVVLLLTSPPIGWLLLG